MIRKTRRSLFVTEGGDRVPLPNRPILAGPPRRCLPLLPLAVLLALAPIADPAAAATRAATRAATAPAADAESAGDGAVRIEHGRITVDVGEVPVTEVLAAVARELRTDVLVRGDLGMTKAQTFSEVPLLDGLERLVQPNNLVVEFAPQRGAVSPRIVRIRVFGFGTATDPRVEPEMLAASVGGGAAARPSARAGAGFDGNLGWSYVDASPLPPLAQRVRRIAGIYAASGVRGVDALRTVVEADPDAAARAAAVRAVAAFAYVDALPLLQQALGDGSPDVRLAAVSAINPGPSDPPMFLVDTILNEEEDARVRLMALERLGRFRSDEQVQDVLTDIAQSDDSRLSQAAEALIDR